MSGKVILGGAQLGLNYGITSSANYVGLKNSRDILLNAERLGISKVDIAYDYGQIFEWINEINPGLEVISKLKLFNQTKVKEVLNDHLEIKKLKYILIHDADDYSISREDIDRVRELIEFCNDYNLKWGISVYTEVTVKKFLDHAWRPDLVQYPHNILCADDEIGLLCSSLNIETHIRSVLLQGLLILRSRDELPLQFRNNYSLIKWYDWLEKNDLDPIDVCLRGANIAQRTKILGVQNVGQLKALIGQSHGTNIECSSLVKSVDKNLLDARNWINVS